MIKNKKHTSKILIIFLTLAGMLLGEADFSFRNISVKDGLAESTVKVVFEDRNGFMYFGTENGLDVYNGYEFNNYQMNSFSDSSILGNKVSAIYEDSNDMIWVGTELGVSMFNPSRRIFTRPINIDGYDLVNPETITGDAHGNIWIKLKDSRFIFKFSDRDSSTVCINCSDNSVLTKKNVNILLFC